jgi:hypothetical protein
MMMMAVSPGAVTHHRWGGPDNRDVSVIYTMIGEERKRKGGKRKREKEREREEKRTGGGG